ncbi:MAG: hypothetical protein U0835_10070 [Isosphaeraceae bacterium]
MGFIDGAQLERLAAGIPNDYGPLSASALHDPYHPGFESPARRPMWSFAWQNLVSSKRRTALAVLDFDPVLAFLGLFSISAASASRMGNTLEGLQGMMVLVRKLAHPGLQRPHRWREARPRAGRAGRRAEVWRIAPPIDGRGGGLAAATGMFTRPKDQGLKGLASRPRGDRGIDILRTVGSARCYSAGSFSRRTAAAGGSSSHPTPASPSWSRAPRARDHPNADGSPGRRPDDPHRLEGVHHHRLFDAGSIVLDMTIVMDIGTARELLGVSKETVSAFNIETQDVADSDAVAERIMKEFPGVRAQRISSTSRPATSWEARPVPPGGRRARDAGRGVGIANTMLMSTSERYVEFGVMHQRLDAMERVATGDRRERGFWGRFLQRDRHGRGPGGGHRGEPDARRLHAHAHPWLVVASLRFSALAIATVPGLYSRAAPRA